MGVRFDPDFAVESTSITSPLKNDIIIGLKEIKENLQKANNKKFSIALLAPRRTGKSVVLNCFLGKEYSPTTGELPTPTNCIYEVSPDNKLRIIQKGEEPREFKTVSDLRNHLHQLFTNAKTDYDRGYSIPEITIQYIPESSFLNNYKIIDTPGPNIAGALQHAEFAKKWIKEADVILYVFEYMHERDNHAINYFKEIKSYFEKYDKFYSLITIDNKLDIIYDNRENPSIIRALNLLSNFLKNEDFKSFALLGTSALQYFNSLEILNIPGCEGLNTENSSVFKSRLDELRKKFRGQFEPMAIINYVRTQIEKLEDFHQIDNPTLKLLKKHSGIERLIGFIKYIATEKASIEVFRSVMRNIDDQYSLIKNKYIILQYNNLEDEKSQIKNGINQIMVKLEEIRKAVFEVLDFNKIENEAIRDIESTEKTVSTQLIDHLKSEIKDFESAIKSKTSSELKRIKKGTEEENIDLESMTIVAEKEHNKVIGDIAKKIKRLLTEQEEKIKELDKELKDSIMGLQKEYDIGSIEVVLPSFDPSFEKPDIIFDPPIHTSDLNLIAKNAIKRKEGILGWILKYTSGEHVRAGLGFRINGDDFELDIRKREEDFIKDIKIENHEIGEKEKKYLRALLEKLSDDLKIQSSKTFDTYKQIFQEILNDLELSQFDIEERIIFLQSIDKEISDFDKIWSKIRLEN